MLHTFCINHHSWGRVATSIFMKNRATTIYETPHLEVIEIGISGVVCGSIGLDGYGEDSNWDSNGTDGGAVGITGYGDDTNWF